MAFLMATSMMASNIAPAFASGLKYSSPQAEIVNNTNSSLTVNPQKTDNASELIKNPEQKEIYTLRTDYVVKRGDRYYINYQPYIASVGEGATEAEKEKINKEIKLPDLAGYKKPVDKESFNYSYEKIKEEALKGKKSGDKKSGLIYSAKTDFKYQAKSNEIKVKHIFQTDLSDFEKYTNPDGTQTSYDLNKPDEKNNGILIEKDGTTKREGLSKKDIEDHELINTQPGNTGSTIEVKPLTDEAANIEGIDIKGYVPEAKSIPMQVPDNAENFVLEYRYNRAHFKVKYETGEGTPIPSRTLYYEQKIPKTDVPTKIGAQFQGWSPSVELQTIDGKTYQKGQIIKKADGKPALDLDVQLKMPAKEVTFTAKWKNNDKADYTVQFWAEKADHADNASILEKYEYMGANVYKQQSTGTRPDLKNEPIKGMPFPDLDQKRLEKIWKGEKFNRDTHNLLDKFFVYNEKLTDEQNKDPDNPNQVKSVSPTGQTVYNIYYDRQVYELYFTKSNKLDERETFYPKIYKFDKNIGEKGEAVKVGGPGNLYHFKARFNELMLDWPNDAMQTKGFTPGFQSYGWGPNYASPEWPTHLDTPPYRLNADEFLDMEYDQVNYENRGGYTKKIDKGDGTYKNLDPNDFTTLSFGIKQGRNSIPHHMDLWMDGFKPDETIIRYDLYRSKADTDDLKYEHRAPQVQGFTAKETKKRTKLVNENNIFELNDERDEINTIPKKEYWDIFGFRHKVGEITFIQAFFSNADSYGDPLDEKPFKKNGYLRFKYSRNKYPLRFNNNPLKHKSDSDFNSKNQLQTYYEFPLKALSPDVDEKGSYNTDKPANFIDNPENLNKLGLTDLVENGPDGNLRVKRPEGLDPQKVFKGWALDPAGTKLVWKNGHEKMPSHAVNLYAKWGEPDHKWKVTFDPDGGRLENMSTDNLTMGKKEIQEGDIGQEKLKTYPVKGYEDPNLSKEENEEKAAEDKKAGRQVFTLIQRQQLKEPSPPEKKGYTFMGWQVQYYKKDANGNYTDEIDEDQTKDYENEYIVPELYSFGNDVVSPLKLKAIWVPNQRLDVKAKHYYLDKDYELDLTKEGDNPREDTLEDKRVGYLVAASGDRQNGDYLLATHDELDKKLPDGLKEEYIKYNNRVKSNNSFFQTFRVEPDIEDPKNSGQMIDNPNNIFKFFYRPFRKRVYKVNYVDERAKAELAKATTDEAKKEIIEKYSIIDQEVVTNGNRYYDARNYRPIKGWKLVSDPQQQLFFDVDEDTNELKGINGTKSDEITFYYKDVRVIKVPKDDPVPKGYVRVTFKAEKGGSFTDKYGKEVTELNYDVIKGLKSDHLPVPKELEAGETKEAGKYYITPDSGKMFVKWDDDPLLNPNTIVEKNYTFTAKFNWEGVVAKELVTTESFKKTDGTWINKFGPTIEDLKNQVVYKEKDKEKLLPDDATVTIVDDQGNALTDEDVYKKIKELGKSDKEEVVRTINFKAKVKFKGNDKEDMELEIPVKVYKNVYEALTGTEKPHFLSQAEEGELKEITGEYVKVTVAPTGDMTAKDNKVYYVNKKAWVNIPEAKSDGSTTFIKWTADDSNQNEGQSKDGEFKFKKRHKFTKDTVIKPVDADDVVEQKEGEDKPKVPDTFVKVIVKATDKATDAFTKTFWVNPSKEVTIAVTEPTGKKNQEVDVVDKNGKSLGKKTVTYTFKEWQKVQIGETDTRLTKVDPAVKIDLAKNQYIDKVTIIEAAYKKSFEGEKIQTPLKTSKLDTPEGKTIEDKDLIEKITPQEGKEIASIEYIENRKPDPSKPGEQKAKVIVKYKDGTTQGTKDKPVIIPVEVHKNIIPEVTPGKKPEGAMDNYVKVTFKPGEGGKFEKTLTGNFVYYVSPEVEVDLTEIAGKIQKTPSVGYISDNWDTSDSKKLKDTFKNDTEFTFNFKKSEDIVEKTDNNVKKPDGYVKVTFKTEDENKGKLEGNKTEKIYYVNPKADIKLVELAEGQTAGEKQLAVPKTIANDGYTFTEWVENLDTTKSITGDREYVAQFSKGQVTLTYDAGEGATGNAPEKVTVAKGTKVRLARPDGLSKKDHQFTGWKFDNDQKLYQPGDEVELEKSKTATAQWTKDDDIISYNPEDPITKPKGYHRVKFEADNGLTLSDVNYYYVKDGKTLKLDKLTANKYPTVNPKVGYKFDSWDKGPEIANITEDITVKARSTELPPTIEKKDGEEKPNGYVEVKFVAGENGVLVKEGDTIAEKVYYVNPNKYVTLTPPDTKGKTGFKFGAWDKDAKIPTLYTDKVTTITAKFNNTDAVIPKTSDEVKKPDGYNEVIFVIEGNNGIIPEGQTFTFYVDPNRAVTITPPSTKADTGYVFEKWDQNTVDTAKKYTDERTLVKGKFKELDQIIPSTNDEGKPNAKPEGYVTVTFEKGDHGTKIEGQTIYYVNPKAGKTLADITKKPKVTPDTGYLVDGWDQPDNTEIKTDITVKAKYSDDKDVIEKTGDDVKKPDGYVTVTFIPTDKAENKDKKVYYVNPNKEVTIPVDKPTGKTEDNPKGFNRKYTFKGWKVTKGTINNWDDKADVKAKFTQDTEITAQYSISGKPGKLLPAPKPKKDVITPIRDVPEASSLIENIPGSSKDPLPDGTKITYADGGKPDVNKEGNTTAKVKIEYPGGKTVVVEVPIIVSNNVVEQYGKKKPDVPDDYVKVVVDTTDMATENTKFVKTFWVKKDTEVTIPVQKPNGKTTIDKGVENSHSFEKWVSNDSNKEYKDEIKDSFSKETRIEAKYVAGKNIDPVANNDINVDKGSTPNAKDFIKNHYDDNDPTNKDNLPPGTKYEFEIGKEPNTDQAGNGTTTVIVTYPNGEQKKVDVTYKVPEDVVEQTDPNNPPDVPKKYVEVKVVATDKSNENYTKIFWVNPDNRVKLPIEEKDYPTGADIEKGVSKWIFTGWDGHLEGRFVEKTTTITAQFIKYQSPAPLVDSSTIVTNQGKKLENSDYEKNITAITIKDENGEKVIDKSEFEIVEVTKGVDGTETIPDDKNYTEREVTVKIKLKDGSNREKEVPVTVRIYRNRIKVGNDGGRPDAPANYVQVVVDPTDRNDNPNKEIYYVNPEVQVQIPDMKIKPTSGTFKNWTEGNKEFNFDQKYQFKDALTYIKANYYDDVIEQIGDKEPVKPDNYVKVIVRRDEDSANPTENIYWVVPGKEVKLPEADRASKKGYEFNGWKYEEGEDKDHLTEDKAKNFKFFDASVQVSHVFTKDLTVITAKYKECGTCRNPGGNTPGGGEPGGSTPGGDDNPGVVIPNPENPDGGNPGDKPEDKDNPDNKDNPKDKDNPDNKDNPKDKGKNPNQKGGNEIVEIQAKIDQTVKTVGNAAGKIAGSVSATVNSGVAGTKKALAKVLNPRTGIITNYEFYLGLMAASSVGLFFTREKKNKDEE